jgi:hypothetical protein
MKRLRLFLDVDGVILQQIPEATLRDSPVVRPGSAEFLAWAVSCFDVFWLTGWYHHPSQRGNIDHLEEVLASAGVSREVLRRIRPLAWRDRPGLMLTESKLAAIPPGTPFAFVDDMNESSYDIPAGAGRVIQADPEHPGELKAIMEQLVLWRARSPHEQVGSSTGIREDVARDWLHAHQSRTWRRP